MNRNGSGSQLFAFLVLAVTFLACAGSREVSTQHLSGSPVKYWKADVGYNWAFSSDGSFREYREDSMGRHSIDYGDFKLDGLSFQVQDDSLLIYAGQNKLWAYKVLSLSTSDLVITSPRTGWGIDTIKYRSSADQVTEIGQR
jgi:hypothetical protein